MTKEAQRLAIATAVGFKEIIDSKSYGLIGCEPGSGNFRVAVPDYLNDLNAMFEAEKILDENQQDTYWCQLRHIVDAGLDDMQHCFNTAHATAEQKSRAFLFAVEMG